MSLIVFPFKREILEVVAANLEIAARHDRVDEVWAVAADEDNAMAEVAVVAADVGAAHSKTLRVFPQERLGRFRPGKGDGMNTAIAMAAERGFERIHFYDADITNFDATWIDGAEDAADRGFGVVRHRFPRAATDAMITWMITRPAMAKLFPGTLLPRLGQPLGGEILLTGDVLVSLANDPFVKARSDWGIDTILTHATAVIGDGVYEHNSPDGKRHALYGSLTDIRDMVLECLDAAASLGDRPAPGDDVVFAFDPPAPVPDDLKETVAYDMTATRAAIAEPPDDDEGEILASLGVDGHSPAHIDAGRWGHILDQLLTRFDLADEAWRSAVFRVWVERVITYTNTVVIHGYDHAMAHLETTIRDYEDEADRNRM
jgi:mannosylglycerate synthase